MAGTSSPIHRYVLLWRAKIAGAVASVAVAGHDDGHGLDGAAIKHGLFEALCAAFVRPEPAASRDSVQEDEEDANLWGGRDPGGCVGT
jgi:hypothetical protein